MANLAPGNTITKTWTVNCGGLRAKGPVNISATRPIAYSNGALSAPGKSFNITPYIEWGEEGFEIVWWVSTGPWGGSPMELSRSLFYAYDADPPEGDSTLGTVTLNVSAVLDWNAEEEILPCRYPDDCHPVPGFMDIPDFCGFTAGLEGDMLDNSPDGSAAFDGPVRVLVSGEAASGISWELLYNGDVVASGTEEGTLSATAEGVGSTVTAMVDGPYDVVIYGDPIPFGSGSVDASHCDYGDIGEGTVNNGPVGPPQYWGDHWSIEYNGLSGTLSVASLHGDSAAGGDCTMSIVGEIPDHSIKYRFEFPDNPGETFIVKNQERLNTWSPTGYCWTAGASGGLGNFEVASGDDVTVDYRGRSYIYFDPYYDGTAEPTNTYYCTGYLELFGWNWFQGILVDDTASENAPDGIGDGTHTHYLEIVKEDLEEHNLPWFPLEPPSPYGYGDWRLPLALEGWDWEAFNIKIDAERDLCTFGASSVPSSCYTDTNCTLSYGSTGITIDSITSNASAQIDFATLPSSSRPWLSHYRFARLHFSAASVGDTLRLGLGNKYWDLTYSNAGSGYSEIDLCRPDGVTGASLSGSSSVQQSWLDWGFPESTTEPVSGITARGNESNSTLLRGCCEGGECLTPERSWTVDQSWYWGVDEVTSVTFSSLTSGSAYTIEKIEGYVVGDADLVTRGDWGWRTDRESDEIAKVRAGLEILEDDNRYIHSIEVGWWVIVDGKCAAEITGQHWKQSCSNVASIPCGRERTCPAISDLELYPDPANPAGGGIHVTEAAQASGYLSNERSIRHLGNSWLTPYWTYTLAGTGSDMGGQARPDAVRLPFSGGLAKGSPFTMNVVKRSGHTLRGLIFDTDGSPVPLDTPVTVNYTSGSTSGVCDSVGSFSIDLPTQALSSLESNVTVVSYGLSAVVPARLRRYTFCGMTVEIPSEAVGGMSSFIDRYTREPHLYYSDTEDTLFERVYHQDGSFTETTVASGGREPSAVFELSGRKHVLYYSTEDKIVEAVNSGVGWTMTDWKLGPKYVEHSIGPHYMLCCYYYESTSTWSFETIAGPDSSGVWHASGYSTDFATEAADSRGTLELDANGGANFFYRGEDGNVKKKTYNGVSWS